MNEFLKVLGTNMEFIGLIFGVFILTYMANMIASLFYNVKQIKEDFSKEKLLTGFKKMLCIGVSTTLISIVITSIPFIFKLNLDADTTFIFTMVSVSAIYLKSITKYTTETLATLSDILNGKSEISK